MLSLNQAVILAGGKGTRLRERLGDKPKPLIDVCGVPLLERQILWLKKNGIQRVILLVNYQADNIISFCQHHANWGLEITCLDDGSPRGTAGAVLQVLHLLEEEALIVYGDTMLEVDLARFEAFHSQDRTAAATLFLHPNDHPHDSDLVELDVHSVVTGFHPYPQPEDSFLPNLVNAALYIIRTATLQPWKNTKDGIFDFGKHLFPMMIDSGAVLRGYNSPEYIKDCGTPSRIDKVSADWASGKIQRATLAIAQKAVFLDRDGTLNKEISYINTPDQLELIVGVDRAIKRLNHAEYRICVVTNQPVIARGECSPSQLKQIHNKLETLLGKEGAYLDRIYYCPHHPDKGFEKEVPALKVVCKCRKPQIGMIQQAAHDLNIDLHRSWMIGDTTTDIQTAKNAGLKSILVETGFAGLDRKFLVSPDYTVPDLYAAVNLILDVYPRAVALATPLLDKVTSGEMIFIGGAARTGKSSMASIFRDVLQNRGLKVAIISTDRWLLSENKRSPGVLGRHDMIALNQFVESLVARQERRWSLPVYCRKTRSQFVDAELIEVYPADVVIVEGVVALAIQNSMKKYSNRYFVQLDETVRRERLLREYCLRGEDDHTALEIYQSRLNDEMPIIENMRIDAQRLDSPFVAMSKNGDGV